jgi:hypothetical protein
LICAQFIQITRSYFTVTKVVDCIFALGILQMVFKVKLKHVKPLKNNISIQTNMIPKPMALECRFCTGISLTRLGWMSIASS